MQSFGQYIMMNANRKKKKSIPRQRKTLFKRQNNQKKDSHMCQDSGHDNHHAVTQ